MRKFVLLLGLMVAGFLVLQFHKGILSINDVFRLATDSGDIIKVSENIENNDGSELEVEPVIEPDSDLTVLAFGDMMLGRAVRSFMNKNGNDYVFEKIVGEDNGFFSGYDVVFANLEGPINGKGTSGGTSMVFSFNEDIAPLLKGYHFNVLSITNNHALDQGWNARNLTIEALEKEGIGWCGHPTEADPSSVYYGDFDGKKVAFICFQDVTSRLDDEAAVELIKSVRPNVDYLIVSSHWGYEYKHKPDYETQIKPGHAFIDAGADFVIGHHPHVVQSFEVYNGKFIFYSLGNFIFDQYWSMETQEELALKIVLKKEEEGEEKEEKFSTKIFLLPIQSELSQPRLMTFEEQQKWIEEFISYGEYDDSMKEMIRSGVLEF